MPFARQLLYLGRPQVEQLAPLQMVVKTSICVSPEQLKIHEP
jgi:hypothetical protein